jgi:hypothetical protein
VVSKADVIVNATSEWGNMDLDRQSFNSITSAIEKSGGNKKKKVLLPFIFILF